MEWCDDDVGGLTRDDDGIAVGGNDEVCSNRWRH